MRIAMVIPNSGMSQDDLSKRLDHLKSAVRPGTILQFESVTNPMSAIETEFDRQVAGNEIASRIVALRHDGYDAFISWCGVDPGVIAARELVDVPVVGPFQASCLIARSIGFQFSVISSAQNTRMIRQIVASFGLEDSLVETIDIGVPVKNLLEDGNDTAERVSRAVGELAARGRTDAVVLAGMRFFGMRDLLQSPIPIVDPGHAAVGLAEMLVAMRLTHARFSYPAPRAQQQ